MRPAAPILTAHLLPGVEQDLLGLLATLNPREWDLPTVCTQWHVRDVAAHLLDGCVRRISIHRDQHYPSSSRKIDNYTDLVDFLNQLNAEWVLACRRLSPAVLVRLLEQASADFCQFMTSLDPFEKAPFPVAWAGEEESLNWFDTARELTERWHHQQQIRDAVNRPGARQPEVVRAVLGTFLRGLPHRFREIQPEPGVTLQVHLTGAGGGDWVLQRLTDRWQLGEGRADRVEASIQLADDLAWRLFTKGASPDVAREASVARGDPQLIEPFFELIAIMG